MTTAEWTLSVRDFWGLRAIEWSPHGVCLLAGPNGSGKTSIVGALELLQIAEHRGVPEAVRLKLGGAHARRLGAPESAPVRLGISTGELRWEIQLPVKHHGIHPNHGEVVKIGDQVPARRVMLQPTVFLGDEEIEADDRSALRMLWDMQKPEALRPLVELVRNIRTYSRYRLDLVRTPLPSKEASVSLNGSGSNVLHVLRNWKASPRKFRDQFQWVLGALQRAFPDIIVDLDIDLEGSTAVGRFYPANAPSADDSLPLDAAADGLLVGLLHLTAVAGAPNGSILAFDEVENQLHPHAIRSILRSMREIAEERDLTILLTSHSPVVMNEFKGYEGQFYVLEQDRETLPVPLDEARDPDWLAHFALGDLYDREDFGAPRRPERVPG